MKQILVSFSIALTLLGCGGNREETSSTQENAASASPRVAAQLQMQQDLLELAHLADIEHHGLFIDFGSPARAKYTVGDWNSGWGRDGLDGDVAFTYVGTTGRVFFPIQEQRDLVLRFQMKPVGSRRMQVFVNGDSLEGVVLQEGAAFRTYDVRVPAARTRVGDNYLLLRFGGTSDVQGERVSVAMGSIRVMDSAPEQNEEFLEPTYDTLISAVEVGNRERRSLALRSPTTLSYHLEVPAGGRLVFGLGAEGSSEGLTARVRLTPDGGEARELFQGTPPTDRWNDKNISLSDFEGQVVRLDFSVEGEGSGRTAFSLPGIMIPPPEVAARPPEIRNVVFVLIDTLRASKLRPFNPESRVQTPVVERLAREGVIFEAAQSPENWTKPSCASVLTGLTPITHGAKTSEAQLPQAAEMISETLDEAGFATGSFIANGYVSDRFGFDQGWDHYQNFIRSGESTEAENVFRAAGDFIEQHHEERFFTYIQTIDPHVPYDPPSEYLRMYDSRNYEGQVRPRATPTLLEEAKQNRVTFSRSDRRRLEALHDGEISYHDHYLGEFLARLEQLGVADNTLLVITSDHGEEFNEHGSWGHGHSIYQELLHVPLMFHLPGRLPQGRRIAHTVSTLNIPQTILDLVGVQGMARAEGRSLLPDMLGNVPTGPQVAFSDFQDIRRVIRAGRYKFVLRANLSSVLFDLEADPREERELRAQDRPIAGRYTRVLLGQFLGARNRGQWLQAEQAEVQGLEASDAEMDDTIRAQLRALGYAN